MKTINSSLAVPAVVLGILLSFGSRASARVYGSVEENHSLYGEPVGKETTETGFREFHKIKGYWVEAEYYKQDNGRLICIGEAYKADNGAEIGGNELAVILGMNSLPNRNFKWHAIDIDGSPGWILLSEESPFYGSDFAGLTGEEKLKLVMDEKTASIASRCTDLKDNLPYLQISTIVKFKMDVVGAMLKAATEKQP